MKACGDTNLGLREACDNVGSSIGHLYSQDRVQDYSILQVEQSLKGASSWREWRDKLKSEHFNPSEGYVDELFANWH